MRQRNETITLKVIEELHADVEKDATDLGVQGMNLYEYSRGEVFGKLFLSLTFPDWTQKLELLNTAIKQKNSKNPKSQRVRIFSESRVSCLSWAYCWCSRIWSERVKTMAEQHRKKKRR
jgi:hypothetical protein